MLRNQAQADLVKLLRQISESAMCAQWSDDIEFIIWDRLGRGTSHLGQLTLTEDLLQQLLELSQQAGGWVLYGDEPDQRDENVRFIDEDAWSKSFQDWLSRVPEGQRSRDPNKVIAAS